MQTQNTDVDGTLFGIVTAAELSGFYRGPRIRIEIGTSYTCFVAHDDPNRTTAQSTATTQTSLLSFFEGKDTDGHCLELKQLRMTTAPGEEFLTSRIHRNPI